MTGLFILLLPFIESLDYLRVANLTPFQMYKKILLPAFIGSVFAFSCSSPTNSDETTPVDSTASNPVFLFLSDIHLNAYDSTTPAGEDTGMDLWANFLAKADSVIIATHPGFIVYTGDLPAHYTCVDDNCYIPPAARDSHNTNLSTILDGLRALADRHHTPLFYLPGNNDGLAGDYYSFADEQQQTPLSLVQETTNPFPALNINSGTTAPCMVANPHPAMGYYSALPVNGLRLIALNTVMFSHKYVSVDSTSADSDRVEQMNWIAAQLADAAANGQKVYIAMHIPPGLDAYSGKDMWHGSLCNEFLALTMQYQSTITGILYGHTHMDEVRRLYDTTGTAITEIGISCPGVTPLFGNNPGFKVVQYDSTSKELMDFTTYYTTPLSQAWGTKSYTFSSTYGAAANTTLFQTLSTMPLTKVDSCMSTIFTVKNGAASYNTTSGIEVKQGM